nr:8109_t:CDS:2 [Entrophospora candida]
MSKRLSLFKLLNFKSNDKKSTVTLPADILYEVFSLVKDDPKTLHSCILVNRLWCEITAPYLWSKVFKSNSPPASSIISIFIASLEENEKLELSKAGIKITNQLRKPPTFDYVSFIQHVSLDKLYSSILKWTQETIMKRHTKISSLSLDRSSKLTWMKIKDNLGVELDLSNIRELTINYTTDKFFFEAIEKQIKNLKVLNIIKSSDEELSNFKDQNFLSSLIFSQYNLNKFSLKCYDTIKVGFNSNIFIPLASQSDTLTSLSFYGIPFPNNKSIKSLKVCKNLQELEIRRCTNCLEEINDLNDLEFPELTKINLIESSIQWTKLIQIIVKNNPKYLKEFIYQPWELLEESNNNLTKTIIKYLSSYKIKLETFGISIIEGAENHHDDYDNDENEKEREEEEKNIAYLIDIFETSKYLMKNLNIWPELGKYLPVTLKHLNIWIFIGAKPMKDFLFNTKAKLDTLYIDSWNEDYLWSPYNDVLNDYIKDRSLDINEFFYPAI